MGTRTVICHSNGCDLMAGTRRTRFADGVLESLERLNVPEGEALTITIILLPLTGGGGGLEHSTGGWQGRIDADELQRSL